VDLFEYQARDLFEKHNVPVLGGAVATTEDEAFKAASAMGGKVVVKAQVKVGGRGKAGGVKLAKSPEEARNIAEQMIGMTLVTHQTGPEGKKVHKVYVEAGSKIAKEYYLALVLDRETAGVSIMFSTEGGMDIEEVAAKTPEKIVTVHVDPTVGLQGFQTRRLCYGLNLPAAEHKELTHIVKHAYKMFVKYDYSMLEINPLVVTTDGKMFALDGKMNFDDNALYRQKDIEVMRDFQEEDERDIQASKYGLSYIGLDGTIGCLVNGAGLAMATLDIINFYGAKPANFLDVGGGASQETVTNAFKILFADKHVKGIFVNIFGGIMKCDIIANGIVAAAKELGLRVPMVVRLEGTNVEQGKDVLKNSGLNLYATSDMADGAKKIVELAK